jgi:hypothetical protein
MSTARTSRPAVSVSTRDHLLGRRHMEITAKLLRVAYLVADEHREDVYLVLEPDEASGYARGVPYVVLQSVASDHEKKVGQLIQWRIR